MNKALLALLVFFIIAPNANAQLGGTDSKPGDACTGAEEGHIRRNASADRDVSEITLICDGTVWQSATGSAADNLGNHTATSNVILGTNWLSGDGGNEGLYVNSDGYVGIRTANPTAPLTVGGGRPFTINGIAGVNPGFVSVQGDPGGWGFRYGAYGSTGTDLGGFGFLGNANALNYYWIGPNYTSPDMVVTSGGNVGIDTTAPQSLLQVANTGYAQFSKTFAGVPTAADCDNALEAGRVTYDSTGNAWYVCEGAGGWQSASGSGALPALASASIWVGNGLNAATAVAMSGDATLSNAGVLTIGSNAVGSAEITNASIALADLSTTGTASGTTYLRGDNTWATVPSGADNLGDHIATTVLRSDTHNTDDLGTTAIRWKDGWFAGTVTGGTFAGSGASLTSLPAANLTGTLPAISGANLTTLNASNLASGTVATARMGSGTANGTTFLRGDGTWAAPSGGGGGSSLNAQTFTASGTWTKPANADVVFVECWGGGGSGARSQVTTGAGLPSGGGGGGLYAAAWLVASSLPASVAVTVAALTPGTSTSLTNGTAGGNSSFGSYLIAGGGQGGVNGQAIVALGGTSVTLDPSYLAPDIEWGGNGGDAFFSISAGQSYCKPGADSLKSAGGGGGVLSNTFVCLGGSSVYGGSGGAAASTGNATAGAAPGGGGGGRAYNGAGSSGAGARGECRIKTITR